MPDPIEEPAADLDPKKTIHLDKPIKLAGEEWNELDLSEPTAGQLEDVADKTGLAWTIAITAANSGIPSKAIRQLPIRVLNEAAKYLTGFIDVVRPTGPDD